jgi:tetratricopeptide (TPR) repeat protein
MAAKKLRKPTAKKRPRSAKSTKKKASRPTRKKVAAPAGRKKKATSSGKKKSKSTQKSKSTRKSKAVKQKALKKKASRKSTAAKKKTTRSTRPVKKAARKKTAKKKAAKKTTGRATKASKAKAPRRAGGKPVSRKSKVSKARASSRPGSRAAKPKTRTKAASSTAERAAQTDFAAALRLYETGFKLLHSDQFEKAKTKLQELVKRFPAETELLDRANVLIQVCKMRIRLTKRGPRLETADDFYQAGVAELNSRSLEKATAHLSKALKLSPRGDHIHYALAAVAALQEDTQEALSHLRAAIEYRDENRFLAVNDADFESLSENTEFQELVTPEGG